MANASDKPAPWEAPRVFVPPPFSKDVNLADVRMRDACLYQPNKNTERAKLFELEDTGETLRISSHSHEEVAAASRKSSSARLQPRGKRR